MNPIIANPLRNFLMTEQGTKIYFITMVIFMITYYGVLWASRIIYERKLPPLVKKLGLTYTRLGGRSSTTITGKYRSIPIYFYEVLRGYNRWEHQKWIFSIYTAHVNPNAVPDGLIVYREALHSKAGKILGGEDIQVGNPRIDQAFIIQGTFTEDAQEFFARPNVAEYFLELHSLCKKFRFENNELSLEFRLGIAFKHKKLRTILEALSRCAHAINQTDPRRTTPQITAPKPITAIPIPPQAVDPFAPHRHTHPNPQKNHPQKNQDTTGHW